MRCRFSGKHSCCFMQDELIDLLGGADNVAELTGRKCRMIRGRDGQIRFLSRALHNIPLDQVWVDCVPVGVYTASAGHGTATPILSTLCRLEAGTCAARGMHVTCAIRMLMQLLASCPGTPCPGTDSVVNKPLVTPRHRDSVASKSG